MGHEELCPLARSTRCRRSFLAAPGHTTPGTCKQRANSLLRSNPQQPGGDLSTFASETRLSLALLLSAVTHNMIQQHWYRNCAMQPPEALISLFSDMVRPCNTQTCWLSLDMTTSRLPHLPYGNLPERFTVALSVRQRQKWSLLSSRPSSASSQSSSASQHGDFWAVTSENDLAATFHFVPQHVFRQNLHDARTT